MSGFRVPILTLIGFWSKFAVFTARSAATVGCQVPAVSRHTSSVHLFRKMCSTQNKLAPVTKFVIQFLHLLVIKATEIR